MRMYPACIGSPRSNENSGNRRASLTVHELRTLIAATAVLPVEQTHRPASGLAEPGPMGSARCLASYPAGLDEQ
jgi:hypothetical protein